MRFERFDKPLHLDGICRKCTFICFITSSPLSIVPNHIVSADVGPCSPWKQSDSLCHLHLFSWQACSYNRLNVVVPSLLFQGHTTISDFCASPRILNPLFGKLAVVFWCVINKNTYFPCHWLKKRHLLKIKAVGHQWLQGKDFVNRSISILTSVDCVF